MLKSVDRHQIRRGAVYNLQVANGRIQPVLVLQNDVGNYHSPTIIVSPLTRDPRAKDMQFTVSIEKSTLKTLREGQIALLSHIRTVSREYFNEESFLGQLDHKHMEKVDIALQMSLGLSVIQKLQSKRVNC